MSHGSRIFLLALFVFSPVMARLTQAQTAMGQGDTVYDIIRNDHKVITNDIQQVQMAADDRAKKDAFDRLKQDLFGHMRAEEGYWYSILQENPQTRDLIIQAKDQHLTARAELEKISANWKTEPPRLQLAQELINDHVRFEEGKLFDASRQVIGQDQEKKITQQFKNAEK